jgi:S-adenosylmethionine decarboxylase
MSKALRVKKLALAELPSVDPRTDCPYYVEKDGLRYAGTHLLFDMWGARHLDDIKGVEAILREAVAAAGATLLRMDLHSFGPGAGVTGVAILAESHISIHTWPETGFAALDIFMCGRADPYKSVAVIKERFRPTSTQLNEHRRGVVL